MHREMVSVTDAEDKELARERVDEVHSEPPRPVSVIDIGTTTIRMTIAEISPEGGAHTLESLSQPVNLGKDTFTTGSIRRSTIKDCVRILKNYGQILRQYRIDDEDRIRVVATTAVSKHGHSPHRARGCGPFAQLPSGDVPATTNAGAVRGAGIQGARRDAEPCAADCGSHPA
jgi:hypothetical protein